MSNPVWEGAAAQIDDYDLPRIGHEIGVGEDVIHAVLDVESRGEGFKNGRVINLFEKHVFYRNLPKNKRSDAVRKGLATRGWKKDYKDNFATFERAYAFDKDAALKACSWGLGQILGENHKMIGFNTVHQMVKAFAADEAAQLEGIIDFVKAKKLDDDLRRLEKAKTRKEAIAAARGFAKGYNGEYYYKHNYHTRIADRFLWWKKIPDTKWSPGFAKQEEKVAATLPEGKVPTIVEDLSIMQLLIKLIASIFGGNK